MITALDQDWRYTGCFS